MRLMTIIFLLVSCSIFAQKRPDQQPTKVPEATDAIYSQENPAGEIRKIKFDKAREFFLAKNELSCISSAPPAFNATSIYKGKIVTVCANNRKYYVDGDGRAQLIYEPGSGSTYSSGTGININPSGVISNLGDTNASDDITTATTLNGDLNGSLPNPTVDGLQGRPLSAAAPNYGHVIKWSGNAWVPAQDANNVYTGGSGITVNSNIISATDQSATNEIQQLQINGNELSLTLGGGTVVLPSASSGTYTAGTGVSITGNTIANTGDLSPTNEIQTLSVSGNQLTLSTGGGTVTLPTGTTYTAGTGISLASNAVTNTGDTDATNDITTSTAAAGDLSGTFPTLTVNAGAVAPNEIGAGGATAGQVMKFDGSNWVPGTDLNSGGTSYTAGTGISITGNTIANTGDLSPTNEIQTLSVSGNQLTLSTGGGTVTLPSSSNWATSGTDIYRNSSVSIATTAINPSAKLDVAGVIEAGSASATSGTVLFKAQYDLFNAQTILTQHSSGAIGFGAYMYQNGTNEWRSGFNYGSVPKTAFFNGAEGIKFYAAPNANVAAGLVLPVQPSLAFKVTESGHLGAIGRGSFGSASIADNGVDHLQVYGTFFNAGTIKLGGGTSSENARLYATAQGDVVLQSVANNTQMGLMSNNTLLLPFNSITPTGVTTGRLWVDNSVTTEQRLKYSKGSPIRTIANLEDDFAGGGAWAVETTSVHMDVNRNANTRSNSGPITLSCDLDMIEGLPYRRFFQQNSSNAITVTASGMGGSLYYTGCSTTGGCTTFTGAVNTSYEFTRIGTIVWVK